MTRLRLSLLFVLLISSGCTTFNGIRPIYPDVGHPGYHIPKTESLQPTLRWKSPGQDANYDLIIFEGPEISDFLPISLAGKQGGTVVYYRENLKGTEHKVEDPLNPGHIYFWSVRTRIGDKVSGWSSYNYYLFAVVSYYWARDVLFRFRTPEQHVEPSGSAP